MERRVQGGLTGQSDVFPQLNGTGLLWLRHVTDPSHSWLVRHSYAVREHKILDIFFPQRFKVTINNVTSVLPCLLRPVRSTILELLVIILSTFKPWPLSLRGLVEIEAGAA